MKNAFELHDRDASIPWRTTTSALTENHQAGTILRHQQAETIIATRTRIVEDAVSQELKLQIRPWWSIFWRRLIAGQLVALPLKTFPAIQFFELAAKITVHQQTAIQP